MKAVTLPVDLTQRMLHLRQIPIGAALDPSLLRVIAGYSRPRIWADGQALMKQGDPIDTLQMLTEGRVLLSSDNASLGEIRAPQTLGFLAILARQEAPYEAIAEGEVQTLELETDTLLELLEDHFDFLVTTVRYLAERLYYDLRELPAEALGIPPNPMVSIPAGRCDIVQRVLMFQKISGFSTTNLMALAALSRQVEELRLPAGEALWKAGDPSTSTLFLVDGNVRCETPDGRVFSYGAGTGVGGIEVLCQRPRWYDATTTTPILGFRGHSDYLFDLFENQFAMATDFIAMLARAELGIVARRTKLGHEPLARVREVAKLGAARFGA